MKKFLKIDSILIVISIIGASVGLYKLTVQQSMERYVETEQVGYITNIKNDIKLKPKGSYSWNNLTSQQDSIFSYDYIYSGKKSFAAIKFKNGDSLKINPESLLLISPDKDDSISLIVYEGTAQYKAKDSLEEKTINKSEELNLNMSKNQSVKKAPQVVRTEAPKVQISMNAQTISEILTPPPPPPPPVAVAVVAPVEVIPEPPPPPVKKIYTTRVAQAKASLIKPTALKRYAGEAPILEMTWPADATALKYIVSVFSNDDLKKPIYKTTTPSPKLLLKWKKAGQFTTMVEKQIKRIDRPPALTPDPVQFVLNEIKKETPPDAKFPLENQMVLIDKKSRTFLNWKKSKEFSDYILNISTDPNFKSNARKVTLDKNKNFQFDISRLPAGTWYWQIKGLSESAESDWSRTYKFRLLHK